MKKMNELKKEEIVREDIRTMNGGSDTIINLRGRGNSHVNFLLLIELDKIGVKLVQQLEGLCGVYSRGFWNDEVPVGALALGSALEAQDLGGGVHDETVLG